MPQANCILVKNSNASCIVKSTARISTTMCLTWNKCHWLLVLISAIPSVDLYQCPAAQPPVRAPRTRRISPVARKDGDGARVGPGAAPRSPRCLPRAPPSPGPPSLSPSASTDVPRDSPEVSPSGSTCVEPPKMSPTPTSRQFCASAVKFVMDLFCQVGDSDGF
eukprot:Skav218128  [mRNA]  locus=scaffold759:318931:319422:- [translate_table: standard]